MNEILKAMLFGNFDPNPGYYTPSQEQRKLSEAREEQHAKITSALGEAFADEVWDTAHLWANLDRDDYFERGFCLGGQLALLISGVKFS